MGFNFFTEAVDNMYDPTERNWLTKREREVLRNLEAFLRNDGNNHRYKYYADLLAKFTIVFVNYEVNPSFTASADFQHKIIRISTGFIIDDELRQTEMNEQLSVLIRHEMAHILMKHQMRMSNELLSRHGDDADVRMMHSASMHHLYNIIADFEIANRRYFGNDKNVVRNMKLNNILIGGLITEDFKKEWEALTLEEMYDELDKKLTEEHIEISQQIEAGSDINPKINDKLSLLLKNPDNESARELYNYVRAIKSVSEIPDVNEFINELTRNKNRVSESIYAIATDLAQNMSTKFTDIAEFNEAIKHIASSSPTRPESVISPKSGEVITTLYTPEEKYLAIELLKSARDDLNAEERWYTEIVTKLANLNYTKTQIAEILRSLDKDNATLKTV